MSSDELDGVFHAFKSGQADILIATTIVENAGKLNFINRDISDQSGADSHKHTAMFVNS